MSHKGLKLPYEVVTSIPQIYQFINELNNGLRCET